MDFRPSAGIDRWLWPDEFKNRNNSVAKAKKATAGHKKAVGRLEGLAERMVFYCERAVGFRTEVGLQDERQIDAIRLRSHDLGYGVGDDMDARWMEHGLDD